MAFLHELYCTFVGCFVLRIAHGMNCGFVYFLDVFMIKCFYVSFIDGVRIAKSTPISSLLQNDFELVINDRRYLVPATPSGE